ncbi:hypothetical protein RhiirA5_428278 [Rhizophagus irregularis]|uniref:Uncharacterized protein n=1 Tax=Rhizophagus irregularis TaxID=588596 RepID=A0A2N0P0N5_9GLOM|nr:hypothetical protein RhiirA5_428278 [Rhizophagus irregularis]
MIHLSNCNPPKNLACILEIGTERTSVLWVPELPSGFQTWNYGKYNRRKYQVWTCKLRINAYLLEFWTSEAPVSGHGRWVNTANWEAGEGLIFETLLTFFMKIRLKSNISSINSIDPLTPTGLSFSSQTELNDFGASSQAKLTPSARFISSVRHGLDLTTLGLGVQIG